MNKKKSIIHIKITYIISLIIIINLIYILYPINVHAAPLDSIKPKFDVKSQAAFLVNTDTHEVIYEKNANEEITPASLTKIMTAIIAIEELTDYKNIIVTAPAYIYNEFAGIGVSNADIKRGEKINMEDLLYALILRSACEAGSIIADYVADGSIEDFVDMMNEKAKQIGAVNTHFTNAHGLYEPGQRTTAYDMYLITSYALESEYFSKIALSQNYTMKETNLHPNQRVISHTNLMLSKNLGGEYYYEYVKGIKTGTTNESGRNLVTVGSKNGYNYMLVTLGAPMVDDNNNPIDKIYSYVDHINLYEWAFNTFSYKTIINENETIGEIPVKLGKDRDHVKYKTGKSVTLLLPDELDITAIEKNIILPEYLNAPIKKEDTIGLLELKLSNEVIAKIPLVTAEKIEQSELLYLLNSINKFIFNPLVLLIIIVWVLLILVYIVFLQATRKRAKKLKKRLQVGSSTDDKKDVWK